MASSTLATIIDKVRKITRKPSVNDMADATVTDYINTFIMYDFPQEIRLFSLRTNARFFTQPNIGTYNINDLKAVYNPPAVTNLPAPDANPNAVQLSWKNVYTAYHDPMYIAGIPAYFTQYQDVFYGQWPKTEFVQDTLLTGNNTTGPFTGTLNYHPIEQRTFNISCQDNTGTGTYMTLVDYPRINNNTLGDLVVPNQIFTTPSPYGTINYLTGAFTVTFPTATLTGSSIKASGFAYGSGLPTSILFYGNEFVLRPIPDKVYEVKIEADMIPSELLQAGDVPFFNQWWQYIAYGAAKKILEDELDYDSLNLIIPTFKEQQDQVIRSTLSQYTNERTVTVFTMGKNYGGGFFGRGSGWPY